MKTAATIPLRPKVAKPLSRGGLFRRLARFATVGLVGLYVLGVSGGYVWAHWVRKYDEVGLIDIALFRKSAVKRGIAAQQFLRGKAEWDAKKYQAAYIWYTAALRNDPDNVPGRLQTASFLTSLGGANMAVTVLEEGLARTADNPQLVEHTFELLFSTGHDRQVLELLHKFFATRLTAPNGQQLRAYEVRAAFNVDGTEAAQRLLEKYPDLQQYPAAVPLVAQVMWNTKQRLKAIDLLNRHLAAQAGDLALYARLADWQQAGGLTDDAIKTARRACTLFPRQAAPRILLIGKLTFGSPEWSRELETYLREFSGQPEAVVELANLCGNMGWVDLVRSLYLVSANSQENLNLLAISYGDVLARTNRLKDVKDLLDQVETQMGDANSALFVLVRQRQVMAAAARGDHEGAREYARRLAVVLRADPELMENVRQRLVKLGVAEAAIELAAPAPRTKASIAARPKI